MVVCLGRLVTVVEVLALLATGLVAGIVSTVVSLASVVSYPALLAIGLPPLSASMTNTVSLLFTGVGAAAGSRPELAGQGARVRRLGLITALGGAAGATLLLLTPPQTFARAAPILIGVASLVLLGQPDRGHEIRSRDGEGRPLLLAGVFCVAIYVGYFGAAGGILMLAALTAMMTEPIARTDAGKHGVGAVANGVAAVWFAVVGAVCRCSAAPRAGGFPV